MGAGRGGGGRARVGAGRRRARGAGGALQGVRGGRRARGLRAAHVLPPRTRALRALRRLDAAGPTLPRVLPRARARHAR